MNVLRTLYHVDYMSKHYFPIGHIISCSPLISLIKKNLNGTLVRVLIQGSYHFIIEI